MENNENEFQTNPEAGNQNGFAQGSAPFENGNQNGFAQGSDPSAPFGNGNQNGFAQGSDPSAPFGNGNENGFTQAPNSDYNMNGQQFGNPYGQQPVQPEQSGGQGMAIAGMVLGILSLVCCCSGYIALVLGVVGFILSLISLIQKRPGKGMAIAGIICSAVAVVMILVLMGIGRSVNVDELQKMLEDMQSGQNTLD